MIDCWSAYLLQFHSYGKFKLLVITHALIVIKMNQIYIVLIVEFNLQRIEHLMIVLLQGKDIVYAVLDILMEVI